MCAGSEVGEGDVGLANAAGPRCERDLLRGDDAGLADGDGSSGSRGR